MHDRPAACLTHGWDGNLRPQEDAFGIHIEHAVPLCLGDPLKRKGFAIWIPSAADAGIVDQYIQLAKARHR